MYGMMMTTMTPRHPMYYEISRTAARNWNDMENDGKNTWKYDGFNYNS